MAPGPRAAASQPGLWATRGLFTVAAVFLLVQAKSALLPVLLATVLALVLAGPVRRLRRLGIPEPAGAGLVVSVLLLVAGIVVAGLANPAMAWLERAPTNLGELIDSLERLRDAMPLLRAGDGGPPFAPSDGSQLTERLATEGIAFTRVVLVQFAGFAITVAATVILLYFLLAAEHWLVLRMVERTPERRRRLHLLAMGRAAQRDIARYLVTMTLVNVGLGTCTGLAVWALGLPNPALWGTVTVVLNFVPYLGPLAIACLLLLAGVLSFDDFERMIAPAGAFLALNAVESNLVTPWLIGRRLDLNPVVVFASVIVWGWAWGIAGALIAVPVLLGARAWFRHTRGLRGVCGWLERPVETHRTLRGAVHWGRRPRVVTLPRAAARPAAREAGAGSGHAGAVGTRIAAAPAGPVDRATETRR